ncbi:MAG: hypothetical protein OXT67_13230 [Zetaproteobacteria bacterium]|nr:hypothetical protein [Zetaproteobacteria bacterium]
MSSNPNKPTRPSLSADQIEAISAIAADIAKAAVAETFQSCFEQAVLAELETLKHAVALEHVAPDAVVDEKKNSAPLPDEKSAEASAAQPDLALEEPVPLEEPSSSPAEAASAESCAPPLQDAFVESSIPLLQEFDRLMADVFQSQLEGVCKLAGDTTGNILQLSNGFMDEKAKNAIMDFHQLYMKGTSEAQVTAEGVNRHVDVIFTKINEKIKHQSPAELSVEDLEEGDDETMARLSVSGIQRRLEMIISLEEGIKEKLIPILHSMQFEDVLNQRVQHLSEMWATVFSGGYLPTEASMAALQETYQELAKKCSSLEETGQFYRTVLHQEPPEAPAEPKKNLVDILF